MSLVVEKLERINIRQKRKGMNIRSEITLLREKFTYNLLINSLNASKILNCSIEALFLTG